MNRYRVPMTVYEATSFDREIDAIHEAAARQFAKQSVERDYPNASEIMVDEVELLTADPSPQPDPLAQARDIIAGLLDAANQGSETCTSLRNAPQTRTTRSRPKATACEKGTQTPRSKPPAPFWPRS